MELLGRVISLVWEGLWSTLYRNWCLGGNLEEIDEEMGLGGWVEEVVRKKVVRIIIFFFCIYLRKIYLFC